MCQIFRVHITFFVENFSSLFFLSLYRILKKVKARCIKQKSERPSTGLRGGVEVGWEEGSDSTDCGVRGKAGGSRSLSVSGILRWKEEDVVAEGGVGGLSEVSSATPRPRWSPLLRVCPNTPSLALRLADWASFLSVLKQDRGTLSLTETTHINSGHDTKKTAMSLSSAWVGQRIFSQYMQVLALCSTSDPVR